VVTGMVSKEMREEPTKNIFFLILVFFRINLKIEITKLTLQKAVHHFS